MGSLYLYLLRVLLFIENTKGMSYLKNDCPFFHISGWHTMETNLHKLINNFRIFVLFRHSYYLKNERPTWCHLLFYFTSYVLNMFRTLIYPSSGACDCVVELPHRSSFSQFVVCWRFGAIGFEWCSVSPNLQHTTNWEQDDRCGNSTTQSQAPDNGYINVRNMLST